MLLEGAYIGANRIPAHTGVPQQFFTKSATKRFSVLQHFFEAFSSMEPDIVYLCYY